MINFAWNGGTLGNIAGSNLTIDGRTTVFNIVMNNAVAHTLAVSGANTATLLATARLTGVGDLVKTGTGTLILNAANTYTGATNVDAGTLQLGATGRSPRARRSTWPPAPPSMSPT